MEKSINLTVNGQRHTVLTDPERPLLDVLREDLHLTGTKYGCGEGRCAACTVLVRGKSMHSCITSVGEVEGESVLTIEGLAEGDKLHPVQEAFIAEAASQCGYCTPGMILGVVSLLNQTASPTREQIFSSMEGHICRCCNYPRLVNAIERSVRNAQGQSR